MRLVNESLGKLDEDLDLQTLVPRSILQEAYLRRLIVDTEFAELRLAKEKAAEERAAASARMRVAAVLFTSAVFSLLLASVIF